MERYVEAEWLDELPVEDPAALGSRRDLRVLNFWMGNVGSMAQALKRVNAQRQIRRMVELGSGDGHFLLRVARQLGSSWESKRAVLVDRQRAVCAEISQGFARLGWELEVIQADVFDWVKSAGVEVGDAVVANLFAHHFDDSRLRELLAAIAGNAQAFLALEPRRSVWALGFSRLVRLLGCNQVTRHDAPASVRAGFRGNELSQLWPRATGWMLREGCVGAFSHLFVARRTGQ